MIQIPTYFVYPFNAYCATEFETVFHCLIFWHANPGAISLISARSHTFVEIDCELLSMVILLFPLIQKGLVSVTRESMCAQNTDSPLSQACSGKSVVR